MRIPAIDLIGEHHMKLSALEKYFSELADIGSRQPAGVHTAEKMATARSLDHLRQFRLEFEAVRLKHRDAIQQVIAGERPYATLSFMESKLIESISEMYEEIWANRASRHAQA